MADKYINAVGLQAIKTWSEGKFALDADLDALDARVDEIIAEGGEPNVIETVKVNGTTLTPDAQKAVNVAVPTFERDVSDGGSVTVKDGSSNIIKFQGVVNEDTGATDGLNVYSVNGSDEYINTDLASIDYVDANGGKIDTISVNNTPQTITNKNVNLRIPEFAVTKDDDDRVFAEFYISDSHETLDIIKLNNGVRFFMDEGIGMDSTTFDVTQPTIDSISINGTAQTIDANKNVDLDIPSEVFVATYNTTTYSELLDALQNNKIIRLNNGSTIIEARTGANNIIFIDTITKDSPSGPLYSSYSINTSDEWDVTVTQCAKMSDLPMDLSDLANESQDPYQKQTDVQAAISSAVTAAYKYKGSVATVGDLPSTGQTAGDVYDVQATGMNYAWNGTTWDALGQYVDTSVFWTSTTGQTNTLEAMTVAEVNAILEPSA